MQRAFYIHIGLHKTGTTSIQRFLSRNRTALLRAGVLYPTAGELWGAHFALAFALNEKARKNPLVPDDLDPDSLFAELEAEVTASSAEKVVISAEAFSFFTPAMIDRLYSYLSKYRPKILVYLRRQDQLVESEFAQRVKQYENPERRPFQVFLKDCRKILPNLDFHDFLQRWASVFGRENLLIGILEEGQMRGDLTADFMSIIGVDRSRSALELEPASNVSPAPETVELVRISNLLPMDIEERREWNAMVFRGLAHLEGSRTFYQPGQRAQLLERFHEQNESVARRFLERNPAVLFYDLPSMEETDAFNGFQPEDVVRLFREIWSQNGGN